ncbi:non-ribosomal peptide synthetase [Brevibacillus laterosporus]|uniref:non-ribosomal peptide synthetase n=1 Tax=Brevibacillus laterosporus TaxID=1465 RepID=UPI000BDA8881|nr:non-ribosomal peptide synthetase [Brevibacillus laterosporus]PCN44114.1 non-ribosomal peptide synthetase [Brevibacillus laterosporus]
MLNFDSFKLDSLISETESDIKAVDKKSIAIIGMSGQFPKASHLEAFWNNLCNGEDCIGPFPESRQADTKAYLRTIKSTAEDTYYEGAFLEEIDKFDAAFFRLSPKEASYMSPTQRLFLESAWHALEDAGYGGETCKGSKTGVYVGFSGDALHDYKGLIKEVGHESIPLFIPGNLSPIIASRIAYLLDLRGPSLTIDTTCSSSAVAIHTACQALRNGECNMAIAGSVGLHFMPLDNELKLGIESSTRRTRAFDRNSDGTGVGEGVAALILKPLHQAIHDRDHIYAVIKGSALNHDGTSNGLTAPNVLAQKEVILAAWQDAGIEPETISYIEAHGTGTALGDPIEVEAIQKAFRTFTDRSQFCAIGSVKSNIGHLGAAAGVAGIIKSVLALKHKKIPPTLHFEMPNRQIAFENSPVYVNTALRTWETKEEPLRCGISSFGLSGTNCHIILEEAPVQENEVADYLPQRIEILAISAKSLTSLQALVQEYIRFLSDKPDEILSDICYTANRGRSHYTHRLALAFSTKQELIEQLEQAATVLSAVHPNESRLHVSHHVFYGIHKIVREQQSDLSRGKVSEREIQEFTQEAKEAAQKYLDTDRTSSEALVSLCQAYVSGAIIDWDLIYRNENRKRISGPVYPFDRKRYWIESRTACIDEREGNILNAHSTNSEVNNDHFESQRIETILQNVKHMVCTQAEINEQEFDVHANFYDLGFDSILFIQLNNQIKDTYGVQISFTMFFEELNNTYNVANYLAQVLPNSFFATSMKCEARATKPSEETEQVASKEASQPHVSDYQPVPTGNGHGQTDLGGLEQLMSQQLEIMAKQLDVFRLLQPNGQRESLAPAVVAIDERRLQTREEATIVQESPVGFRNLAKENNQKEVFVPYQKVSFESTQNVTMQERSHLQNFITRYSDKTRSSKLLAQNYRNVLANNRNVAGYRSNWKEMIYPIVSDRAMGSKLWDIDGNEYIDICMGFGVNLLGHNPAFITEAINEELKRGFPVGPMSRLSGEVAELISEIAGVDRVAFYNSGTEAVMVAVRIARAYTGRSKIAIFAGSYHGSFDGILARTDTAKDDGSSKPMAPGVPASMSDDILVLEYGSEKALQIIRENADDLAAVLVEPVQSRDPELQPKEFLHSLRALTTELGTTLIFDEVITGFRIHPGGAQAWFGVQADMVTYGKIVGGGMPIGVVAGKTAYLDCIDGGYWQYGDQSYPPVAEKRTFVAGTFCHHPLTMVAAKVTLEHLKQQGSTLQEEVNQRTARMCQTLNAYFREQNISIRMVHFGSLFRFVLKGTQEILFYHLLFRGIYTWEGRNCFLSTAHTDQDVEKIIDAVKDSVEEMKKAGFFPDTPLEESLDKGVKNKLQVPLSEEQKQLWFFCQLGEEESRSYNECFVLQLTGQLKLDDMRDAIQQLVDRHESLRTTISADGEYQCIHPKMVIDVPLVDFLDQPGVDAKKQAQAWMDNEGKQVFHLEKGPLFKAYILQIEKDVYQLVFIIHHIIADGWSVGILVKELEFLYTAAYHDQKIVLPEPMQYRDFIAWQDKQQSQLSEAVPFWEQQSTKPFEVLDFPSSKMKPAKRSYIGNRTTLILQADVVNKLREFSKKQRNSLFMTLLASFQVFLHKITGQNSMFIGIPSGGQALAGSSHLVGQCVNMLPIHGQIEPDMTFEKVSSVVKKNAFEVYQYQHCSMALIGKMLAAQAKSPKLPGITATFNMDRPTGNLQFPECAVEFVPFPKVTTKQDIGLNVIEVGAELHLEFEYNADLSEHGIIDGWINGFARLVEDLVRYSDRSLSGIPLLTHHLKASQNLKEQVLLESKDQLFIHEQVEKWALEHPDKNAVLCGNSEITYQSLHEQSNQLASWIQQMNIEPNQQMIICLPTSIEAIVSILAVIKAGYTYTYLNEEVSDLLQHAVVITREATAFVKEYAKQIIDLQEIQEDVKQVASTNLQSQNRKDKMVQIVPDVGGFTHQQLMCYAEAVKEKCELTSSDCVYITSADEAGFWEKLWIPALVNGATLRIAHQDDAFLGKSNDTGKTIFIHKGSQLDEHTKRILTSLQGVDLLKLIVLDAEVLLYQHLAQWKEFLPSGSSLLRTFSMKKVPMLITAHEAFDREGADLQKVPLGYPIGFFQPEIIDDQRQPVPVGVAGNLYLTWGHVDKQFVYATRELTRFLSEGELEYIGNTDNQARRNNHRIYTQEIEAVLELFPGVDRAIVRNADDQAHNKELLSAYLFTSQPDQLNIQKLRSFLSSCLPEYMRPTHFVKQMGMPLRSAGGLDLTELPDPFSYQEVESGFTLPANDTEEKIWAIWSDVLGSKQFGTEDNFFDLGGQSLQASTIAMRMQKEFDCFIPLHHMFLYPTIRELAANTVQGTGMGVPLITKLTKQDDYPVSSVQKRLYVLAEQEAQNGTSYNLPVGICIEGKLDYAKLREQIKHVISRHEALRTSFHLREGEIVQQIHDEVDIPLVYTEGTEEQLSSLTEEFVQPFVLSEAPLIRLQLVKVAEEKHILLLDMHHIISDGLSMNILIKELLHLYQGEQLPELSVTYKDFAAWQNSFLSTENVQKQETYWRNLLAEPLPELNLPVDVDVNTTQNGRGHVQSFKIDAETTAALKKISDQCKATLYHTLFAVYEIFLAKCCYTEDTAVLTVTSGRTHPFVENMVGMFVHTLPVRLQVTSNKTWLYIIEEMKQQIVEMIENQDYPLEYMVERLQFPIEKVRAGFTYQSADHELPNTLSAGELTLTPFEVKNAATRSDVSLLIQETNDGLSCLMECNAAIFNETKLDVLIDWFKKLLIELLEHPMSEISKIQMSNGTENSLFNHLALSKSDYECVYPLTTTQRDMYYDILLTQNNGLCYLFSTSIDLPAKINQERWKQATEHVFNQTPQLHAHLLKDGAALYQAVKKNSPFSYEEYKTEGAETSSAFITKLIEQELNVPWNLFEPKLVRFVFATDQAGNHTFCILAHNLIIDGVGVKIIIEHIIASYEALENGTEYKPKETESFPAYVSDNLQSFDTNIIKKHWKEKLSNVEQLSTSGIEQESAVVSQTTRIPAELFVQIKRYCEQEKVRLSHFLWGVYGLLVKIYSNQQSDFLIRNVINGRSREYSHTVGNFYQVTPLLFPRHIFKPDMEMKDYFAHLMKIKSEDHAYRDISMMEQKNIIGEEEVSFYFNYLNFTMIPVCQEMTYIHYYHPRYSERQVNIWVKALSDTVELSVYYDQQLFPGESFLDCFIHIAKQITDGKNTLSELDYLGNQAEIIDQFNATEQAFDTERSIYHYVEDYALKQPKKVALHYQDCQITYQELNEGANRLGHLLSKTGLTTEGLVGIYMERAPRMVESILAVWKVGAAYTPIDPEYPLDRVLGILQESQAQVLLTTSDLVSDTVRNGFAGRIICLDQIRDDLMKESADNVNIPLDMNQLSYVIYTSGSTGKPKGAMVEHIGMMNHIFAKVDGVKITSESIVAQNSSHCFDISVWQFFVALVCGGTTVIYPNELILNTKHFIDQVGQDSVTVLEVVPSYLSVMLDLLEKESQTFQSLEYLLVTGETLKQNVVKKWFSLYPSIPIINAYGPTEASDDITHYYMDTVPDMPTIPIGQPLQNFNIYIVNENLQQCPIGVKGEILVSGIGVGRGYLYDTKRTQAAFMDDPFPVEKGRRMYKTGDLGRWLPGGIIEFYGRKDHQVKIRGFRIELGEIESKLVQIPAINEAIVTDLEDEFGNKYLCGYIVCNSQIDNAEVKAILSKVLPAYMIPSYLIQLDKMPVNTNGKVDRKALPVPVSDETRESVKAANITEEKLLQIWESVLGIKGISVTDHFFENGGHSLKAIMLLSRIHKVFDVEMSLRQIFEMPTIKEQATYLRNAQKSMHVSIQPGPKKDCYPLSDGQKSLFLQHQLNMESTSYNMPGILLLEGELDKGRLEKALQEIVHRHESLRTSFDLVDGEPMQIIQEESQLTLNYINVEEREIEEQIKLFVQPFDLSKSPLLRVTIAELSATRHLLFVDLHHIISDGVSLGVFIREIMDLYQGKELAPLSIQYKDFTNWQAQEGKKIMDTQGEYWKNVFANEVPVLSLPTDWDRPKMKSFEGERIRFVLDSDISQGVYEVSKKSNTTLFMLLMAAYQILLAKYANQEDIVTGTAVAGRSHADLENVMGMFINILPIRTQPQSDKTFVQYLGEVKQLILQAFEHQQYPMEQLPESLKLSRDLSRNPLFDTMFTMQNMEIPEIELEGMRVSPYPYATKVAKFDLTLEAKEQDNRLHFELEYATSLFTPETAERMTRDYQHILRTIVLDDQVHLRDISLEKTFTKVKKSIQTEIDFHF